MTSHNAEKRHPAFRGRALFWQKAGRCFLFVFPLLLAALIAAYPVRYQRIDGDYHFTLNALMNHGTPDIRASDFEGPDPFKKQWMDEIWNSHPDSWYCLSKNEDGVVYGQHFWLWPLLCVPLAKLFFAAGLHPLLSHSVTLGLFLWGALWLAWRCLKLNCAKRFAFILMAGTGPVLFYLWVLGGEGFMYVAVLWAVVAASRRRYDLAAAAAAFASLQNTSLVALAACLAAFHFLSAPGLSALSIRRFFVACFSLAPVLISPLFYFWTFGRPTLFADIVPPRLGDLSLKLFMMEFFDLNAGLVLFMPLAVALYFAAWGRETHRLIASSGKRLRTLLSPNVAMLIGPLVVPAVASLWVTWNTGYLGLMRWALPLAPFLLGTACSFRVKLALPAALASSLIMTAWVGIVGWGSVPESKNYLSWGPVSRVVLRYAPSLCGVWTDEVMYERTFMHPWGQRELDGGPKRLPAELPVYPIAYCDPQWGPRKILTTAKGWKMFRAAFDFERPELFAPIDAAFAADEALGRRTPVYFDMPAFRKAGLVTHKRSTAGEVRYAVAADLPKSGRTGEKISFDLKIANDGKNPFMPTPRNMPTEGSLQVLCGLAREGAQNPDGSLDLVLHDVRPLADAAEPGESSTLAISMTLPGPGRYVLVALLGRDGIFFMTGEGHSWLKHPIEVME